MGLSKSKTDQNSVIRDKVHRGKKSLPEGLRRYQELYQKGLVKQPPASESWQLRAELCMETIAQHREWITQAQAEAIMSTGGFHSDISTIPLKDIGTCPIRLFEDNFDLSGKHFTDSNMKRFIKDNGEIPFELYTQSNVNRNCYTVKHQDPRFGYLDPNFRLRNISNPDTMWWYNMWKNHKAPLYNHYGTSPDLGYFTKIFKHGNLYGKGFWYYPILLARVTASPFDGLTIKNLEKETSRAMKVWDNPISIGREYVFTITHKDDPDKNIGYVSNRISRRIDDDIMGKIQGRHRGLFYSPEAAIRGYRKAIKEGVVTRKEAKDYHLIRYRVVLGKPYHVTSKWVWSQDTQRLTKQYSKGSLKYGDSPMLDWMIDNDSFYKYVPKNKSE